MSKQVLICNDKLTDFLAELDGLILTLKANGDNERVAYLQSKRKIFEELHNFFAEMTNGEVRRQGGVNFKRLRRQVNQARNGAFKEEW